MTYDLTLIEGLTNPLQYFIAINTLSNGLFGGVIIVILYFILFVSVQEQYLPNTLVGVSFIMSIVSGGMWVLGFLPGWTLGINITFLAASILIKIWAGRQ